MSVEDWDWRLAADPQDYPWDCAACSLAWAMRAVGYDVTEQDVIAGLGPGRISPTLGLLDASGAGLVSYLAEMGIEAHNNPAETWEEVKIFGGTQPMVMGGRAWNHWTAVRMSSAVAGRDDLDVIALMNPSNGWMGVSQILSPGQFSTLGPFSGVWLDAW